MLSIWRALYSFVTRIPGRWGRGRHRVSMTSSPEGAGADRSSSVPVVVMACDERARAALMDISARSGFPMYFAESPAKASEAIEWLRAPVTLFDRDMPGIDWRVEVQRLSSSGDHPCVILMSSVIDDFLWEEVVRCGGYDVVAKPLEAEHLARVIRLALSYRKVAPRPPRTIGIS